MFEKRKIKKQMQQKADADVSAIYGKVNKILHHYPIGLSMYENIAYYTLIVAYGNAIGKQPDDELEALRTKLYFSNLSAGMSSAQRGMIGIEYDRTIKDYMDYIRFNGTDDLKPLVQKIMEYNNTIFPEQPRDTGIGELRIIEGIIKEQKKLKLWINYQNYFIQKFLTIKSWTHQN